jgi:hypothetical protein
MMVMMMTRRQVYLLGEVGHMDNCDNCNAQTQHRLMTLQTVSNCNL